MFYLSDKEIDFIVMAMISPPPYGFTKTEKEEILAWLKSPSFLDIGLPQKSGINRQIFQYDSK